MKKTVGYKAMNMDMTCRDFQFEVGKTYKIENDKSLNLCTDSGFHFCEKFEDVFKFYNWYNCRVFKVETSSKIVTDGQKSITKEITIVGEVAREDLKYEELESESAKNYYNIILETDEKLIFDTFKNDSDYNVRKTVVTKLTDENLIVAFKDDSDYDVRKVVVDKLTNEQLVFDNFKNDPEWTVRKTVVNKLTDENLIVAFKDDSNYNVRKLVQSKLS